MLPLATITAVSPSSIDVDGWTNLCLKLIASAVLIGTAVIAGYAALVARAAQVKADSNTDRIGAQHDRIENVQTQVSGQAQQLTAVAMATPPVATPLGGLVGTPPTHPATLSTAPKYVGDAWATVENPPTKKFQPIKVPPAK